MSEDENKALIRRYFEAIDKGDPKVLDEFLAPDIVTHSPPPPGITPDLEGFKKLFTLFKTATPDGYHTIDDLIAEGDKVAARITGYGTHDGDLLGIPPTHKPIKMSGMVVWRIKDGKIVEHWGLNDTLDLMQQLGALPQLGKPST